MLSHEFGVDHYPQFYYQRLEKYKLLLCPYLRSFEGKNGEKMIKETCILYLVGKDVNYIWGCIETMTENKY